MNGERQRALAGRQQQLLTRGAALREQVAADFQPWQAPLMRVDRLRSLAHQGWHWMRAHPEVPAGAAVSVVVLVAVLRPGQALRFGWRWGRRAWLGWNLIQRLQGGSGAASTIGSLWRSVGLKAPSSQRRQRR